MKINRKADGWITSWVEKKLDEFKVFSRLRSRSTYFTCKWKFGLVRNVKFFRLICVPPVTTFARHTRRWSVDCLINNANHGTIRFTDMYPSLKTIRKPESPWDNPSFNKQLDIVHELNMTLLKKFKFLILKITKACGWSLINSRKTARICADVLVVLKSLLDVPSCLRMPSMRNPRVAVDDIVSRHTM